MPQRCARPRCAGWVKANGAGAVMIATTIVFCRGIAGRAGGAAAHGPGRRPRPGAGLPQLRLRGGVGEAMPSAMAKVPGPKLLSHRPMRLDKTRRWLAATTFDGSAVESPWEGMWSGENYTKDELLWTAAEIGDAKAAARVVEAGADINSANLGGQTALHKCAMIGHPTIWCLSTLILLGADPRLVDGANCTALDYAKEAAESGGPLEPVRLLMEAEHASALRGPVQAMLTDETRKSPEEATPAERDVLIRLGMRDARKGERQCSSEPGGQVRRGNREETQSTDAVDLGVGVGGEESAATSDGEMGQLVFLPPSPEEYAAMAQVRITEALVEVG